MRIRGANDIDICRPIDIGGPIGSENAHRDRSDRSPPIDEMPPVAGVGSGPTLAFGHRVKAMTPST
jgi:hypothetical protein